MPTSTLVRVASGNVQHYYKFPISGAEVRVKKDEFLRYSIELTSSGATDGYIGSNPAGTAENNVTDTTHKLFIPFEVDQ